MRKIINFDKTIEFPTMIGEITSISLDDYLKFKDSSNIIGKFVVKGTYKRTEATRLEEEFNFDLPTEILLTEKLDLTTSNIEIDDFYYEVENDDTINCHISLLVEGVEIVDFEDHEEIPILEEKEEKIDNIIDDNDLRECDGDTTYTEEYNEELDIPATEVTTTEDIVDTDKNINKIEEETVGSLFTSLNQSEETFSTYSVYIVREEETIENIMTKFKVTKEDLENYNDISNISIGSKLIIPVNENN